MNSSARAKQGLLIGGDLIIMAASLVVAMVLRGREEPVAQIVAAAWPWAIVIVAWIVLIALAGLYDIKRLRNDISFLTTFLLAVVTNVAIAMTFFYLVPVGIAPKTTLLIFAAVYVVPGILWRRAFNSLIAGSDAAASTLVIGGGKTAEELVAVCKEHPKHGYRIVAWLHQEPNQVSVAEVPDNIEVVIIPRQATQDPGLAVSLYKLLAKGVRVRRLDDVYEETFGKVPLSEVNETWLLEHVSRKHGVYGELQDVLTYGAAVALQIVLIPLELLIAIAVKLTSRGPVIYSHVRTGQDGQPFTLYKFRSMYQDAEKEGPQWSGKRDPRVTPLGRFLRATHIDELPQLINILKGELSFVGPRPERPEFEEKLVAEIPHYRVRHLVRPGITGWAQVSYRYGSSVEDAREKLQYDLHYLRNRSLIMDLFVIAKTVKTFVATPQ